jgi:hypothetical protein
MLLNHCGYSIIVTYNFLGILKAILNLHVVHELLLDANFTIALKISGLVPDKRNEHSLFELNVDAEAIRLFSAILFRHGAIPGTHKTVFIYVGLTFIFHKCFVHIERGLIEIVVVIEK